jgi:hypothetical protein
MSRPQNLRWSQISLVGKFVLGHVQWKRRHLGLFTTEYGDVIGPAFGYFSGAFDRVPAGDKYYLDIWKSAVDGWRNTGFGEVIVTY